MFIGIILAGDGEVEQAIGPYDTIDAAAEAADTILNRYYDLSFDRVITAYVSTYEDVVLECEQALKEDSDATE